jgi:hypothetical protein
LSQLTVLEAAQQALQEVGASSIPSTLLGTATDSKQILALVYAELRFLRNQFTFPYSKKSHEVNLETARDKYPLPIDFHTPLLGTVWDDGNRWELVGPLTDAEWVRLTKGYITVGTRVSYRVVGSDGNQNTDGGQFQIFPTQSTGATLSFEYQSANLFRPPYWAPSTAYTINTSYVSSNGRIYRCTTSGTSGTAPVAGTGTGIVDGTAVWAEYTTPFVTLLNDNHYAIYDDDILISGIKWRYQRAKGVEMEIDPTLGIPYMHKKLIEGSLGRFNGDYVISMGGSFRYPWAQVPDGGWSL